MSVGNLTEVMFASRNPYRKPVDEVVNRRKTCGHSLSHVYLREVHPTGWEDIVGGLQYQTRLWTTTFQSGWLDYDRR